MNPAYETAVFEVEDNLPDDFVIITAYNPKGLNAPMSRNLHQDATLQSVLLHHGLKPVRVTGRNQTNTHREPGWGVSLELDQAYEIAGLFKQNAFYQVLNNRISLHYCESSEVVELGEWQSRVIDNIY